MASIGVLALQGGFSAHQRVLAALGHDAPAVRTSEQFGALDGLVLPGGESTAQLKLIRLAQLEVSLDAFVRQGKPVLATCAGLILAASEVRQPQQASFGWLDITVERNAYGRQLDSFEATSEAGRPLVFIRAPRVVRTGSDVEVCDRFAGEPILFRQGQIHGATFHPELTRDSSIHELAFAVASR